MTTEAQKRWVNLEKDLKEFILHPKEDQTVAYTTWMSLYDQASWFGIENNRVKGNEIVSDGDKILLDGLVSLLSEYALFLRQKIEKAPLKDQESLHEVLKSEYRKKTIDISRIARILSRYYLPIHKLTFDTIFEDIWSKEFYNFQFKTKLEKAEEIKHIWTLLKKDPSFKKKEVAKRIFDEIGKIYFTQKEIFNFLSS
jgi:hypothetical protein